MDADIRWKQRLANFRKAFGRLDEAVLLSRQRDLSDLERQGFIQAFARAIDARYWAAFRHFLDSMDARAKRT